MGLISALGFVNPSAPAPIDGSHSLDKDVIHGASNEYAVNPESVPDEVFDTIRPFPVWKGKAAMTPEEAEAVVEHCKDFTANAKATGKALDKMTETLDTSAAQLNQKKQKYIRSEARFERRTVGYKHTTGKYLQGQRVGYAKMGLDFDQAQSNADNAIAALSANL